MGDRQVKPWFIRDKALFNAVRCAVNERFPTLRVDIDGNSAFVRGTLEIMEPSAEVMIDRYAIELAFPYDYPDSDPVVRETGGVLPKTLERHFNFDGSACLFLPDARWRRCPPNCPIDRFIEGPVRAFFLWQAHLSLTGQQPPSGDWKHGRAGILQFYEEELGTSDIGVIGGSLRRLASDHLSENDSCYCRSGKTLRDCHFQQVQKYRERIPRRMVKNSLRMICPTGETLST